MMHLDHVLPPYPGQCGLVDARRAPRQQTMFMIGRLVTGRSEQVCLVRNISPRGVGIEHDGGLAIGTEVGIETRVMRITRAAVRWSSGTSAGLEFLEVPHILEGADLRAAGQVLRSPRFALSCDGAIIADGVRFPVRITDIALGGARLSGDVAGLATDVARIDLGDAITGIPGRIRWVGNHDAGFQFAEPLSSRELSLLLSAAMAVFQ